MDLSGTRAGMCVQECVYLTSGMCKWAYAVRMILIVKVLLIEGSKDVYVKCAVIREQWELSNFCKNSVPK